MLIFPIPFTDITHRRIAEQEREDLIKEMEAKNKHLERFTYSISHELKTPLITISGFQGILQKDFESGKTEDAEKHFAQIQPAITTMSNLLGDLLELSRIGHVINAPVPVVLSDIANEALHYLQFTDERSGVKIEISPDMPVVQADPDRIQEVLLNLIENAIKFTAGSQQAKITVDARCDNGSVVCSVRDNGKGIDPAYQERIFNLFE